MYVPFKIAVYSEDLCGSEIAGPCGRLIPVFFFKEFPYCFPQGLHKYTFPPTSDFLLVYIAYIVCTFIMRLNSYFECIMENSTKVLNKD